ncbi:MAG TPA: hypothetical protein VKA63_10030 [Candidatus Krumholzibacteria bacterium]|nr:hypothetical protein [Candidatus Krumholzibacteria bacterium]
MKTLKSLILLLSLSFLWPVPSRAQDPVWPSNWQGIWDFDHSKKICDGGAILEHWSERDTICAGTPILELGGDCSGGALSDVTVHVVCTEPLAYFDCLWTVDTEMYATITGTSIHGTIETNTTYSILCGLPDTCTLDEFWGNLVSPTPEPCLPVPVTDASWGTLKASY